MIKEIDLTNEDKNTLKAYNKISFYFGISFFIAIILIIAIIPFILFLIGKAAEGFIFRGLLITGFIFIPFIGNIWNGIKIYRDIKSGKKIILNVSNYNILSQKKSTILVDNDSKYRIKIDDYILPFIETNKPLTIEITKLSKELLFISHDKENLLDKITEEDI